MVSPTLTDDDTFNTQFFGGIPNALCHLFQVITTADEHGKIGSFGSIGRQRPADTGLMKDLAVTNQTINMRFGKKL